MGGLSTLDLAVIIAYLAGITTFGLYVSRRVKDTEGFFMGNRRFQWPHFSNIKNASIRTIHLQSQAKWRL
jgi:hypothetical protein